eukprot:CAMPEP_0183296332 /NCGR_PEP_ID=MMETSP0160_2-20130417/3932_1 /TAXON_ID=2839 ORGANISM="Odontella Sinensis, Strain Grunow 1884" /NCGR_SAMPLE_ID=MMETSP0160_2 /ASSEMBLY_ACC=CAM_ASM_000250 /LENGTH=430 /DNA_ID=CAMNT_0025457939 /DNA_START=32 /DNA_END=1324 /DNA_ORIENTATION=+
MRCTALVLLPSLGTAGAFAPSVPPSVASRAASRPSTSLNIFGDLLKSFGGGGGGGDGGGSKAPANPFGKFAPPVPGESCTGEKITVVGSTGYIGKAVVRESVRRGYPTVAVLRDASKGTNEEKFAGAELKEFDVTDRDACMKNGGGLFEPGSVDVVVSCLASRTGSKKDSYAIDYRATLNVAEAAKAAGARRFVLLSAYCVKSAERKDPYALQFQYAKMELEGKLRELSADGDGKFDHVSVRPTAFFKSVSGQLEVVNGGNPFVYFDLGDGKCATCNPISEPDLAAALIDCVASDDHRNAVWNLGGPDDGLSMIQQGEMLHEVLGKEGPPKLLGVPIGIFDVIIDGLQWVGDTFKSEWFEDAAEFGRIGKYYAVEDMLTTEPSEKYGRTTLREHYAYIAENGQEYDPYTTVFGSADAKKEFKKEKELVEA